jgi:hypothetical protein
MLNKNNVWNLGLSHQYIEAKDFWKPSLSNIHILMQVHFYHTIVDVDGNGGRDSE